MVSTPKEWDWCSYRATAYSVELPSFLSVDWILGQFSHSRQEARKKYRKFVSDSLMNPKETSWKKLVGQIIFGGKEFVADIQNRLGGVKEIGEIPRIQRFPGRPALHNLFSNKKRKDKAARNNQIKIAHFQHGYTLKEIADELELHDSTISKCLKG